jgi:hypothetical protein
MSIFSVVLAAFFGKKTHFTSSPLLYKGRPVSSEVLSHDVFRHIQVGLHSLPLFRLPTKCWRNGPLKMLVKC